jgi:hypothetical protein
MFMYLYVPYYMPNGTKNKETETEIPTSKSQVKPVGLPGSDIPCKLNEFVCNVHKTKENAYRKRKSLSIGQYKSGERRRPLIIHPSHPSGSKFICNVEMALTCLSL